MWYPRPLSSLRTLHEALRDKLKAHLLDSKLTLLLPEAPHCSLTVYINAPSLTALLSMPQVDESRHSSYWNVTQTLYMKSLLSLKCAQASLKCTNCSFSFLNVSGGQLRRNPWLHRSSHFSPVSLPPSFSPCSSCSGTFCSSFFYFPLRLSFLSRGSSVINNPNSGTGNHLSMIKQCWSPERKAAITLNYTASKCARVIPRCLTSHLVFSAPSLELEMNPCRIYGSV